MQSTLPIITVIDAKITLSILLHEANQALHGKLQTVVLRHKSHNPGQFRIHKHTAEGLPCFTMTTH